MFDDKNEDHTHDVSVNELYAQWSASKKAKAEKMTCLSENKRMNERKTSVPTDKGRSNIDPQEIIALCLPFIALHPLYCLDIIYCKHESEWTLG